MLIDKKTFDSRKGLTVLMLESSPLLSTVIRGFLADTGITNVLQAKNIEDASELVESQSIDAVIVDSDGLKDETNKLLSIIRHSEKSRQLPFIIITGEASIDEVQRTLLLGNVQFLVKPFSENIFLEKLSASLSPESAYLPEKSGSNQFKSKILYVGKDNSIPPTLKLQETCEHVATVYKAMKCIESDVEFDICILDEEVAKNEKNTLRQLLHKQELEQVVLIMLLSNMSPEHIENIHQLGVKYVIEKNRYDVYLAQLIPLIIERKKALLNSNKLVRQVSAAKSESDDLRDSVLKQIISTSQNIISNSELIRTRQGLPKYITDLAQDTSESANYIRFWANAVEASNTNITKKEIDFVVIGETLTIATHLLKKLFGERKLSISNHLERDFTLTVNPVLFNSLFMFVLQSLAHEVSYQSELKLLRPESKETNLSVIGKMQHLPRLKSVCKNIQLTDTFKLNVAWKEQIKRLMMRCNLSIVIDYSPSDEEIKVTFKTEGNEQLHQEQLTHI